MQQLHVNQMDDIHSQYFCQAQGDTWVTDGNQIKKPPWSEGHHFRDLIILGSRFNTLYEQELLVVVIDTKCTYVKDKKIHIMILHLTSHLHVEHCHFCLEELLLLSQVWLSFVTWIKSELENCIYLNY